MRLLIDIGEENSFHYPLLEEMCERNDLEIVYDINIQCEYIITTRWRSNYNQMKLKAVFVPYTGLNRFPVKELKSKGIDIINTHAKAHLVAERALALTLTLLGKVMVYHNALKNEGRWLTRENWGNEFWYSLRNKRCAIIGMGAIGKELVNLLRPFNCKIINLSRDIKKELGDEFYETFEELVAHSDIIFFSCALTSETKYLVNMNNYTQFKNKFIVNISRGDVIEEEALYQMLKENIILGAAVDVWYQYPRNIATYPSKYDIHLLDNIVMSPHASCHATEFKDAYYIDITDKLEAYIRRGYVRE